MQTLTLKNNFPPIKPAKKPGLSKFAYFFGLVTILSLVYSQYLFPIDGFLSRIIVIYGVPIVIATWLLGKTISKNALKNNSKALGYGLAYWAMFTIASYIAEIIILNFIASINPGSLGLLEKANPRIPADPALIWAMIPVSIFIIGPAEEYIFRGFVFGGLLKIFGRKQWFFWAFVSSLIFAAVHLYYLMTFGVVSSIFFVDIIAIGLALSMTYYISGGNLLIPILLHGFFDAAGFLSVAMDNNWGIALRISLVAIGVIMAIILFLKYLFTKIKESEPLSYCENC